MALYHLGLTVSELGRSLAFYRDVVGMSAHDQTSALGIDRAPGETAGQTIVDSAAGAVIATKSETFDELTNNVGSEVRVAFLRMDAFHLQLVQYVAGGGSTLQLQHNNVGNPHLSFWVTDVEEKFAAVRARGDVTITSGLVQIVPTMRSFYTADPDGVPVEFIQFTA